LPFPEVALKNGVAEIRAKNPNLSFTNAYNQLMREQPKLFVEATGPAMETDRDQRISDACQEIMKKNPGMMFETAYNLLVQTRPDLFPGATGSAMEKEEKKKRSENCRRRFTPRSKREKEPHLTFF
jgi:predicted nucleic acid-binding Zn ribbon protein